MAEGMSGPPCVLCAAMGIDDGHERVDGPESDLFRVMVAAAGAIGFVAMFLL